MKKITKIALLPFLALFVIVLSFVFKNKNIDNIIAPHASADVPGGSGGGGGEEGSSTSDDGGSGGSCTGEG